VIRKKSALSGIVLNIKINDWTALNISGISILNCIGFIAAPSNTAYIAPLEVGEKKSARDMNLW
jgi:hypothetical protein